jgi:CheY-like chemotaxis protein
LIILSLVKGGEMGTQTEASQPWRILVVDDNKRVADIFARRFDALDCLTKVATQLSSARRDLVEWKPHLILLDLHMVDENWRRENEIAKKYEYITLAFCAQVTSDPAFHNVMIAFLTIDDSYREIGLQAGAHEYFIKDELFDSEDMRKELLDKLQARNAS